MSKSTPNAEIASIRNRIAEIDRERQELAQKLEELENSKDVVTKAPISNLRPPALTPTVTSNSPAADKVTLFRRLLGGRTDVFPTRW